MKLKFIYVCSPFRSSNDIEKQHNTKMAEHYCQDIIKENAIRLLRTFIFLAF